MAIKVFIYMSIVIRHNSIVDLLCKSEKAIIVCSCKVSKYNTAFNEGDKIKTTFFFFKVNEGDEKNKQKNIAGTMCFHLLK